MNEEGRPREESLDDQIQAVLTRLQDDWRRYLDLCRRAGHKPLGWAHRLISGEDFWNLALAGSNGTSGRHVKVDIMQTTFRRLKDEDRSDFPPMVSFLCKTCSGAGRVCALCGDPDSSAHTHKVGSQKGPVRMWNYCPVCIDPFEMPSQDVVEEEEPVEEMATPEPEPRFLCAQCHCDPCSCPLPEGP